jgi:hypothetical protein
MYRCVCAESNKAKMPYAWTSIHTQTHTHTDTHNHINAGHPKLNYWMSYAWISIHTQTHTHTDTHNCINAGASETQLDANIFSSSSDLPAGESLIGCKVFMRTNTHTYKQSHLLVARYLCVQIHIHTNRVTYWLQGIYAYKYTCIQTHTHSHTHTHIMFFCFIGCQAQYVYTNKQIHTLSYT